MGCGKILRDYIEDQDITQTFLAEQIGIPQSTLSGYLSERRIMPEDVLIKIVTYFDITADFAHGLPARKEISLSEKESELIDAYRALNPEQRDFLRGFLKLMQKK